MQHRYSAKASTTFFFALFLYVEKIVPMPRLSENIWDGFLR
jgi:hypothetical protein